MRLELTTPALLNCTVYKYRALTDCATGADRQSKQQAQIILHFDIENVAKFKKRTFSSVVRCGVRTHALFRESELKSDALDHSANLTLALNTENVYRVITSL